MDGERRVTLELTDKQLWNLARAVIYMKRKCEHLVKKQPDDEVMINNVAAFTELRDLIDSQLDDDMYGWNFVTQQGEEG